MPRLAFVPGPIADVQGRSFRSFRPRQVRGLAAGVIMGVIAGLLGGWSNPAGMVAAFAAALPGFAFGFLQIRGKPIEDWLLVAVRYHLGPQSARVARRGGGRSA